MEAIILAGGFGTRLRHIVKDVPKPMAPICGKPFLWYVLNDLKDKGIDRFILAVGYKKECIKEFFGCSFCGIEILYSDENEPLYTGGAIKQALSLCQQTDIFIINGDTFFDVNLAEMYRAHQKNKATLTIATKCMKDFNRYGTVITDETKRIIGFTEKKDCAKGNINGGIYLLTHNALDNMLVSKFSFELDYMQKKVSASNFYAFPSKGYFIDIGIPEDYAKAQEDFADYAQSRVF